MGQTADQTITRNRFSILKFRKIPINTPPHPPNVAVLPGIWDWELSESLPLVPPMWPHPQFGYLLRRWSNYFWIFDLLKLLGPVPLGKVCICRFLVKVWVRTTSLVKLFLECWLFEFFWICPFQGYGGIWGDMGKGSGYNWLPYHTPRECPDLIQLPLLGKPFSEI